MRRDSLSKINLKKRLWIAFSFATFSPLAILIYYLVNFKTLSWFAILITGFVIFVGWWFIFNVFSSILKIQNKSLKTLESIEESQKLKEIEIENEVERLDMVFNILSSKVKESVEELKKVSFKTEELNKAITQKVNIFSTILQAHTLFSQGSSIQDILQFLVDRLKEVVNMKITVAFFQKKPGSFDYFLCGINPAQVDILLSKEEFKTILNEKKKEIIDKAHSKEKFTFHKDILGLKNILIFPIRSSKEDVGVIIVGNSKEDFSFSLEDCEIVELFTHYMGILWEHNLLSERIQDLEIYDSLTGIYNEKFLLERLDEEIKRAVTYRRPCGFVLFRMDNYYDLQKELGLVKAEKVFKRVVNEIKSNIRPIDIIGRIGEDKVGVILIEKNKRQSKEIASRLKERISSLRENETNISFAVAETPLDGESAFQLFKHAQTNLASSSSSS